MKPEEFRGNARVILGFGQIYGNYYTMEYCEMELLLGVKYVGLGKYVKVGIYTILSGTLGAVQTGVKLVSPLGTICTRFLDVGQGLLQPLLRS